MLLTNGFRPDPRVAKEAQALAQEGYEVTVLAWDREQKYQPEERFGEVLIQRVRAGWAGSMLALALRYPTFFAKAFRRAMSRDADVVHAHDFDTLALGALVARLKRVPLVFDAHEHYADMVATDLPRVVADLIDRMEAFFVRRADLVVAVNEAQSAYLRPNARGDIVHIDNCVDLPPEPARFDRRRGPIVLFYAGTLEPMRYIEESIRAAESIDDCVYKVAGFGRLEPFVVERATSGKVRFLGLLPHAEMMREMASSDAVLCLLDPQNINYRLSTPNKLYEAMAVGVPILTTAGTLSGDIVAREGCGAAFEWSDEAFRQAVEEIRDVEARARMGRAGRRAAEREYNWPNMRRHLLDGYGRVLKDSR